MKKVISLLLILTTLFVFTSCNSKKNIEKNNTKDKVLVMVSFNPLKEFTKAIGKDKVLVKTMIPNGSEPHDFEPKIKDMESLEQCDIFVYNGLGMENWKDKVLNNISNKEKIEIVEASKGVNPIINTDKEEIKEHGKYDPHTWLSLESAIIEARNIKDALVKVDFKNKDFYEKNYMEFKSKLESLGNEYKNKFSNSNKKDFITGHAAFGYLCRDFGLIQNSVEDVFGEGEASAKKLKELTKYCKQKHIKTVFVEENVSEEVSKTLAREVGAKVEKIYTIENNSEGKSYFDMMKYNLEKIYDSLK